MNYLRDNFGRVVFGLFLVGIIGYWQFKPDYWVRGAPVGKGSPTVIMLHGYGAPADDFVSVAEELAEELPGATFLAIGAPHQATGGCGRSWIRPGELQRALESLDESSTLLDHHIDKALKAGVELDDLYLFGFSQGAAMANHRMTQVGDAPDVRGVILSSGFFMDEPGIARPKGEHLASDLRVLVVHGKSDRVISVRNGRSVAAFYEKAGTQTTLVEFDGGHMYYGEPVLEFLRDHER